MRDATEPAVRRTLLTAVLFLCGASGASHGARLGRLPATSGGTNYQAVYDTDLDVTWLANANLGASNSFGISGIDPGGYMSWSTAGSWVAALNAANYLGARDWRLPGTNQPDPTCTSQYNPGPPYSLQGYGIFCSASEMAHLVNVDHVTSLNPDLFNNLQADFYWSGTAFVPDTSQAWLVDMASGFQSFAQKIDHHYVLAVRPGDIGLVPPDSDGDGVTDDIDNCTLVPNASQLDSDGDGYGNACDADFNNDGIVNINDFNRLKARLGITPVTDVVVDMDGNGAVNINDLNRVKSYIGHPPGPSALHPNCPPTCP
jgi:hypothetical protein